MIRCPLELASIREKSREEGSSTEQKDAEELSFISRGIIVSVQVIVFHHGPFYPNADLRAIEILEGFPQTHDYHCHLVALRLCLSPRGAQVPGR